jgi:excisionase family DNA binding protein
MMEVKTANEWMKLAARERRLVREYLSQRWLYPLKDAARLCGVSEAKLRKDLGSGKLKAKKLGSKVLIPLDDLADYLDTEFRDWPDALKKAFAQHNILCSNS